MAAGSASRSRDSVSAAPASLQQDSYDKDNMQPNKRSPKHSSGEIDGRKILPSSPAKPDVEIIKTTSGELVADIHVCLSPSKVEDQST